MTLTNALTNVQSKIAAPSLFTKTEADEASAVTFNTTQSDGSDDSNDEYEGDTYFNNVNDYDVVSIVIDNSQRIKLDPNTPSFLSILKSNLEAQTQQETTKKPKQQQYIKRKQKQPKEEKEEFIDHDSICSFVGHSYYNEKGSSYIARQQSRRLRPDERRRVYMINEKKDKQREGISTKKQKKLRVVRKE